MTRHNYLVISRFVTKPVGTAITVVVPTVTQRQEDQTIWAAVEVGVITSFI